MEFIKLNCIQKIYGKQDSAVTAIDDINLIIEKGELIAIVGPSGSGKSTLLNILGTLDSPSKGDYALDGKNINKLGDSEFAELRNKYFGFVVQNFALINDYTSFENIQIPLEYASIKKHERKKMIFSIADKLGIKDKLNKIPLELSGGQRQRVAIARALVNNPEIILADEPTGSLDQKNGQEIMKLFIELNKEGKTVVIVTHDLNIASKCKRIVELKDGKITNDNRTV